VGVFLFDGLWGWLCVCVLFASGWSVVLIVCSVVRCNRMSRFSVWY